MGVAGESGRVTSVSLQWSRNERAMEEANGDMDRIARATERSSCADASPLPHSDPYRIGTDPAGALEHRTGPDPQRAQGDLGSGRINLGCACDVAGPAH